MKFLLFLMLTFNILFADSKGIIPNESSCVCDCNYSGIYCDNTLSPSCTCKGPTGLENGGLKL